MRKREMGYQEYGFDLGEEKQLKEYCKKSDFSDHDTLLQAAISSNPAIAADLYYSLITGLSYDKISIIRYIPISKVDFYGYQRSCLATFRKLRSENEGGMCKVILNVITRKKTKGKRKKCEIYQNQLSLSDFGIKI